MGLNDVIVLSGLCSGGCDEDDEGEADVVYTGQPPYRMYRYDEDIGLYPPGPTPKAEWMWGNLRGAEAKRFQPYGYDAPYQEPSLGLSPNPFTPTAVGPRPFHSELPYPNSPQALRTPTPGAPMPYWSLGQVGQLVQQVQNPFQAKASAPAGQILVMNQPQDPFLTVNAPPAGQGDLVMKPPQVFAANAASVRVVVADVQRTLGMSTNLTEVREGYWAGNTTNALIRALPETLEVEVIDPVTGGFPVVAGKVKEVVIEVVEGDVNDLRAVLSLGAAPYQAAPTPSAALLRELMGGVCAGEADSTPGVQLQCWMNEVRRRFRNLGLSFDNAAQVAFSDALARLYRELQSSFKEEVEQKVYDNVVADYGVDEDQGDIIPGSKLYTDKVVGEGVGDVVVPPEAQAGEKSSSWLWLLGGAAVVGLGYLVLKRK